MPDAIQTERFGVVRALPRMEGNPDVPVLSSEPFGWNGMVVERFRHSPSEHYFPSLAEDTVSLYLGQPVNSARWSDDEVHEGRTTGGDVTIKAAGQSVGWRFDGDVDLLVMRFSSLMLNLIAEENESRANAFELRPSFDVDDPAIEHIGLALLSEIKSGGTGGRVYGDALAIALSTHLLRRHSITTQKSPESRGGLSKTALGRVCDFVNDNLSLDIGLSEMAGVANLSRYHFSRQFKHSTGMTPHQYVISRRIERARELLSDSNLSVGEVASATGFTHQSHLAYHVRRRYGVPPSALAG